MNAFFESQFSCYPLSWMFNSCTLNNKINRLHERCSRIIYNDNTCYFTDLLEIGNSVSVHHRNIQVFATELYKFVNGLSPKLLSDCLKLNSMAVYDTRNRSTFYSRPVLHSLTWHRITLSVGTENFGISDKWYEKPFNTHSLQKNLSVYVSIYNIYIYIYIYIYVYVWFLTFVIMLLEHYLLQFYLSFYTSVN